MVSHVRLSLLLPLIARLLGQKQYLFPAIAYLRDRRPCGELWLDLLRQDVQADSDRYYLRASLLPKLHSGSRPSIKVVRADSGLERRAYYLCELWLVTADSQQSVGAQKILASLYGPCLAAVGDVEWSKVLHHGLGAETAAPLKMCYIGLQLTSTWCGYQYLCCSGVAK